MRLASIPQPDHSITRRRRHRHGFTNLALTETLYTNGCLQLRRSGVDCSATTSITKIFDTNFPPLTFPQTKFFEAILSTFYRQGLATRRPFLCLLTAMESPNPSTGLDSYKFPSRNLSLSIVVWHSFVSQTWDSFAILDPLVSSYAVGHTFAS